MGISLQTPYVLLGLVPAFYLLFRWWREQVRMPRGRRMLIAGLRVCMYLLLILAVAGTELVHPVRAETVIFVVDRSASMKDDPRILTFLQDAVGKKRSDDRYGIVAVGAEAVVDQPLGTREEITGLGAEVNRHATNLAEGIRLAAGMIPSQARGKIILLTDGLATHGDAAKEAKLAAERGIALQAVWLQQPQGEEVLLSSLQLPERLYRGEEFPIRVDLESTVATQAEIRLYEGNREAGKQTVAVEKGKNRFLFTQTAMTEGFHRYRVEIEPVLDTAAANNQAHAFTQVSGTPKLLILEGQPGSARNLVNALGAGNILAEVKDPALLPKELDDYKQYAGIVLANLDATRVSDADMERMRTAVRDLGLGLIMTGGPDSFGMGGWFQTPIEEALPVYMDLRGKEQLPSLGLMLVIDKSGSMSGGGGGVDKMELAKEAAIRATDMLNEQDQIGVIAFDGSPWSVVDPQAVTDKEAIRQRISGIFADGGTDIYPALEMAYDQIKQMDTQRKHVILLTDGQSGREDDYAALLEQMTGENITVSTVAVGNDADTFLLEEIAQWGKGRYYLSTDPGSIPKIFSKETALASRTFIVEDPQVPKRTGAADWATLRQAIPPMRAYIATTAKQTAELALSSLDDDPVLARWQYGLGRTVAWTSDLDGKWAPDWVDWAGNSRMWNEIVTWVFPQVQAGQWKTETRLDGTTGTVTVTLPKGAPLPQEMEAVVLNQEMQRETIRIQPVAPGVLEGTFQVGEPGSYLVQLVEREQNRVIAGQTTGLTVSYSPEYGLPKDGEESLRNLMLAGNGKLVEKAEEVFDGDLPPRWERQPIGEWLLMAAALLWPLDIASRRLRLPDAFWNRLAALLPRRRSALATPIPTGQATGQRILDRLEVKREQAKREREERRVDHRDVRRTAQEDRGGSAMGGTGNQATPIRPSNAQEKPSKPSTESSGQPTGDAESTAAFSRLLAAKQRKQK